MGGSLALADTGTRASPRGYGDDGSSGLSGAVCALAWLDLRMRVVAPGLGAGGWSWRGVAGRERDSSSRPAAAKMVMEHGHGAATRAPGMWLRSARCAGAALERAARSVLAAF